MSQSEPAVQPAAAEADVAELANGDLPSAETVEVYEQVLPGAADRILSMLEEQSTHRMRMERTLVESAARTERLGQLLGLAFVLVVFLVGTWLITTDHSVPGTLLAVADLALLAAVFVHRDRSGSEPVPLVVDTARH